MKNVLIIGENSYIGSSFAKHAKDLFNIQTVCAKDNSWKEADFSGFDSILHCAGIAHVKQRKNMKDLYYSVNCDLAVDVAKKAKESGVKQFVFLSSVSIYDKTETEITPETVPKPYCFYGGSKFKAETMIQPLSDSDFNVCIIRPPMVYGHGCPGNFPKLVSLVKMLPIFPNINNKRSMIYINNLCAFISFLIDNNCNGIHMPQNKEYVNTTNLVQTIAKLHNKKIRTTKLFNPLIFLSAKFISPVNKLFGNLTYALTGNEATYNQVEFLKSIQDTVGEAIDITN